MRGRKQTPTALKVVRGNPGGRPLPENEPTPEVGDDAPPDFLSPAAAAHWSTVVRMLKSAKVYSVMDESALALYCEAFARWRDANDQIAKTGLVVPGQKGTLTQSPFVHVSNAAFDQMRKMLIEFGMTPSSRARVQKVSESEGDEFAAFVKKPTRKGNGG